MTTVLVVLVLLVAGGLYVGYRAIQGNYYLAADGTQRQHLPRHQPEDRLVSLSSVYQQTGVPPRDVPGDLSLPTTPTTLAKTQATLTSIAARLHLQARTRRHWTPGPAKYAGKRPRAKSQPGRRRKAPTVTVPPKPVAAGVLPGTGGRVTAAATLTSQSRCRAGGAGPSWSCWLSRWPWCCSRTARSAWACVASCRRACRPTSSSSPLLMLAAHLAVRRFAPYADPLLLPLAALLNGLGIVMIYRLQESGRNGNPGLQFTDDVDLGHD